MQVSPEPARHAGRNAALDGLRGYASVCVVVYHAILGAWSSMIPEVLRPSITAQHTGYGRLLKVSLSVINGEAAVALFFVMSGMVLHRAVMSILREHPGFWAVAWRFLLRRVLRLWPTMAICLVVVSLAMNALQGLAPGLVGRVPPSDLLRNLSLASTPVIGTTWTLAVELAGAPWLLLACLGLRRFGLWRTLPLIALGMAGLRLVGGLTVPAGMLPGLSMLLAGAILEGGLHPLLRRSRLWRLALPAGLAIVFADELLIATDRAKLHMVVLIVGATLVVGAVAGSERGWVHRLLHARVSQYLGRISFSLYLWNSLALYVLFGLVREDRTRQHPLEMGLAMGVVAVLATIPVAHLAERWTERPFIRLGRVLTRGRVAGHAEALVR